MKIFVTAPHSLAGYFFARSIGISIKRCIKAFIAALILMFAGNVYAVVEVGLAIENDLDINGNITVVRGTFVEVAYTVIEDTDNDLNKRDKIQLRRVSDNSLIDAVERGKKKTGTVSLKVKGSEGEQLYVRYKRKTGSEVVRISHPSDPGFTPLLSIAKASLVDLTIALNALKAPSQVNVTGGDFLPAFNSDSTEWHRYDQLENYGFPTGDQLNYLTANIHLPNGATVTAVRCYYYDNDATYDITLVSVRLRRVTLGISVSSAIAFVSGGLTAGSTTTPYAMEDLTILSPTVDNSLYSYFLLVNFDASADFTATSGSDLRLTGCTVEYT